MSDNTNNITIPPNQWVDLYALAGFSVGDAILVQNVGVPDIRVAVQATQPAPTHDSYHILERGDYAQNTSGDSGAWAYSHSSGGKLQVTAATGQGFYPPTGGGAGGDVTVLNDDWLTDAELRAAPIVVDQGAAGAEQWPVRDDYAQGEVLPDQTGAGGVLTFTFTDPVAAFWVAVVGDSGVCKVDHYGGTPSATQGIPVEAGGVMPIPEPASVVRVFAPSALVVTVWGHLRG